MEASQPVSGGTPLPSPPFLNVEGIPNFRDLGGYAVHPSKNLSIRRDLIYRCGEPSRVTPAGIATLKALGITHFYDLRSINEIQRNIDAGRGGIVEWEGCERVFVPVFKEEDYSPEGIAERYKQYSTGGPEVTSPATTPPAVPPSRSQRDPNELFLRNFATQGFTKAYSDILGAAPPSYRTILLHLANEPEKPLVVHCTAGKDRTGVLCALILSLCGVDDETISFEYSLTELGLAEFRERIVQHLMTNPALKDNPQGALNMMSAKAPNMMASLAMIREAFGGAEGYIVEKCGLTKQEVEQIRKNLVVEKQPIHAVPSL